MRFSFKSDDDRWPSDDKGKAAAGVAAGVAAGGAEQPPSGFVQDRFAISFFLDPSPTDAAYEFIRDANCERAIGPSSLSFRRLTQEAAAQLPPFSAPTTPP